MGLRFLHLTEGKRKMITELLYGESKAGMAEKLNEIIRELNRMRQITGDGAVGVDYTASGIRLHMRGREYSAPNANETVDSGDGAGYNGYFKVEADAEASDGDSQVWTISIRVIDGMTEESHICGLIDFCGTMEEVIRADCLFNPPRSGVFYLYLTLWIADGALQYIQMRVSEHMPARDHSPEPSLLTGAEEPPGVYRSCLHILLARLHWDAENTAVTLSQEQHGMIRVDRSAVYSGPWALTIRTDKDAGGKNVTNLAVAAGFACLNGIELREYPGGKVKLRAGYVCVCAAVDTTKGKWGELTVEILDNPATNKIPIGRVFFNYESEWLVTQYPCATPILLQTAPCKYAEV